MAKTITIDGTDYTSSCPLREIKLVECALRGQVGMGTIVVDDPDADKTIPGLKLVTVAESLDSPTRVFTGYTARRTVQRGPYRAGNSRQWAVEVYDINTLADDVILYGTGADREAETDIERITWLLTTRFNTVLGVSSGVVSGSAVNMDATDYRGKTPRDVLEDCAEKSHKNWFLYRFSSGPLLYYDRHTNTNLSSSLRISSVLADVDSSTTFPAILGDGLEIDPERVYSAVWFRYKRGRILVEDPATEAAFRTRERAITMTRVKTSTRAEELAEKYLEASDSERSRFSLSVILPAAQVNEIRAGQRIEVKVPHYGVDDFTWYRITRRTISPAIGRSGLPTDHLYRLDLELWDVVEPTRYSSPPQDWEEKSNATEDDATVIIDRSGITITDGAITVTNGNNVVIIDGSSDILQVVASGTLTVPRNTKRGDVRRLVWVPTGLTADPATLWSMKRAAPDGNWSQVLPLTVHSLSGQILEYYGGRARYTRRAGVDGTEVQGVKGSTAPPLDAKQMRYRILKQRAI